MLVKLRREKHKRSRYFEFFLQATQREACLINLNLIENSNVLHDDEILQGFKVSFDLHFWYFVKWKNLQWFFHGFYKLFL